MSLKIIGGAHGGRVLKSVRGSLTRPLLGQVREALFNILGDSVEDAEVWDLFAGTGATGIEALSRGAGRVLFLEKSNQALTVLRDNLEQLGPEFKERSHALKMNAWDPELLMPEGEEEEVAPSLIFFDPPYKAVGEDPVKALCRAQSLMGRLAPGGTLCFHFREGHLDLDDFDPVLNVDLRNWGSSMVALLRKPEE
jgi:16S rRNA (guanine(966)-N(2))-methyltransferase RsmD